MEFSTPLLFGQNVASRLALIRHPPLRGADGLCYGRTDFPLADLSAFIRPLVPRLAGLRDPDIHSSPAARCRLVADCLGPRVRVDPRLQELDFGAWEGCAWDDLPREALDRWAADPMGFAPPGGETGGQLLARMQDFAADLRAGSGDRIVVTHGGPLKLLLPLLCGWQPDLLAPAPALGSLIVLGRSQPPGDFQLLAK